mmetsp:Transcript_8679/g.21169  ORF Transcript_8679/g.21169 Transcript_8679/m.21169 type:complete len:205 (-) Transcript_8679:123-737(-)
MLFCIRSLPNPNREVTDRSGDIIGDRAEILLTAPFGDCSTHWLLLMLRSLLCVFLRRLFLSLRPEDGPSCKLKISHMASSKGESPPLLSDDDSGAISHNFSFSSFVRHSLRLSTMCTVSMLSAKDTLRNRFLFVVSADLMLLRRTLDFSLVLEISLNLSKKNDSLELISLASETALASMVNRFPVRRGFIFRDDFAILFLFVLS